MTLLSRLVCKTPKIRLIPKAINYQKVFIKTVEKRAQEEITDTRKIKRTKKAKKIGENIITINILLISY